MHTLLSLSTMNTVQGTLEKSRMHTGEKQDAHWRKAHYTLEKGPIHTGEKHNAHTSVTVHNEHCPSILEKNTM